MSFLGRKLHPLFQGEVVSDVCDLAFKRSPEARIKHRVKQNWLKKYDKAGSVLRLEMVINEPAGFKVRKQVVRKGRKIMEWDDMLQGRRVVVPLPRSLARSQQPLPGSSGRSRQSY